MDIEIRKLTPELAEDYARFFDVTPHSEVPDNDDCKCYCVWWSSDSYDLADAMSFLGTPQQRRSYAIQKIHSDVIQGYLAYHEGRVVGWCNANEKAKCLGCYCWQRFMQSTPALETSESVRVKSVFCFAISPDMRRKGVAKLLLARVCEDAARDGFDVVEAYPKKGFVSEAIDFMGPAELFLKCGFTVYSETSDKLIMRKQLK